MSANANRPYPFALGYLVTTVGTSSTALGEGTAANGNYSTATGGSTTAGGDYSFTAGYETNAEADYSTAMGNGTTAKGVSSFAIGSGTNASGNFGSVAMGDNSTASGTASTALNYYTYASGSNSLATGAITTASGDYTTAMGSNASTNDYYGSFVYGDGSTSPDGDGSGTLIKAQHNNEFDVRASGGVNLYTNEGLTTGMTLPSSGGMTVYAPSGTNLSVDQYGHTVAGADVAGTLSGATTLTYTFANAYANTPQIVFSANDATTAGQQIYLSAVSTQGFRLHPLQARRT